MTSIPPAPTGLADGSRRRPGLPSDQVELTELEDAVARLRAVRLAAGAPDLDDVEADGEPAPDDAAELAGRLRARRSAGHVAAAYSAAHGHTLTTADDGAGRRWALGTRTAVVAAAALLVLAVGVAVAALWPRAGVEDLAPLDAGGEPAGSSALSSVAPPSGPPAGAPGSPPGTASDTRPAGPPGEGSVVVHVVGRVAEPGLVTLQPGARVADALEGAGGPTRVADLAALNLARAVVDGEQIYVPAEGEAVPGAGGGAATATGVPGQGGAGEAAGAIDLNTADAAALDVLPGIGPVLAERIVAWRTDNGPFTSVEELTEVSGIGPSLLEDIRDSVRV